MEVGKKCLPFFFLLHNPQICTQVSKSMGNKGFSGEEADIKRWTEVEKKSATHTHAHTHPELSTGAMGNTWRKEILVSVYKCPMRTRKMPWLPSLSPPPQQKRVSLLIFNIFPRFFKKYKLGSLGVYCRKNKTNPLKQ
ncbi:UNVERIFIED_CONTAM: hypothetical protein K2H54_052864 [Gekko kuhli]